MQYTVPHYYPRFRCTAAACPDTCCAGWGIMIDETTLKRYKKQSGVFGNRLFNSIDWKEKAFLQYDHRCAFLNEENLCDIYTEAGPTMLCKTCRDYPRHIEEFEGVREISLSLSCLEAARLILSCPEPVHFLTRETEKEETYPEFDFFLYTKLTDARDVMIRLLQDRRLDIRLRISMVLALAHDMQSRIGGGRLFEIDGLLTRYEKQGAAKRFAQKLKPFCIEEKERFSLMQELFLMFQEMEVLKEEFPSFIQNLKDTLYGDGTVCYQEQRRWFEKCAGYESDHKETWALWAEQLMVYFIFTYFCGAVYDGQAYAKVQMAVTSTLLIQEMAQGIWQMQDHSFQLEHLTDLAHRYSRELEHSDRNLKTIEQMMSQKEVYSISSLLGGVLSGWMKESMEG